EIQAAFEQLSKGRRLDLVIGPMTRTELISACEGGDLSTVQQLLRESAEINATDSTGRSPLMFAAQAGHVEVMELLLQRQADLNLRNCAGHTCVMFAVGGGIKVNNQHERAQQYLRAVQLLLDEGAPVNGVTSYGLSALMLASTSGSTALVELLLERAAEVSLASDIGLTALVMAADKGHAGTVGRLLEKLADVNCRYGNGKTPLMSAAAQAYVEVVRVLLQHTADVNAQSENGYTALLLPDLRREETLSFTGTLGMAARKAWKLLKPCLETW
ncbi:Putative ankyrin repeat protein L93, partial [Durusdinium trenchii]